MSLPEIRGTGRLLTDPRNGIGKNDKPWCSALIKFSSWRKVDGTWVEGEGTVASIITFDDNAIALARYTKGDPVGIHGTVKAAVWQDKPQLGVTATQIWTPEKATSQGPTASPRGASSQTGSVLAEARAAASAERQQYKARLDASRTENAA